MPLNRPALPLDSAPSAVADARRWVLGLCRELGRDDLLECAELGVSELVTNAILHGQAPINVRVRGTKEHPRIEVFDGSRRPPVLGMPSLEESVDDLDEFLTTFGRGLSMVAMSSVAWGASIERDGKVVWFEPATALQEDGYREGVIDLVEDADSPWRPLPESVTVRLIDVDLKLFLSVLTQYNNLRRELRLLALAHEADYPLARDLSHMFATFERQFPPAMLDRVAQTLRSGDHRADLTFQASPESAHIFGTMLEMFDLADAFCRAQRLLSLARSPEQRLLQEWLLDQFMRQVQGDAPAPWTPQSAPAANSHVS
ncbi:ATP-binding protein [Nocardioides solisilvae]|uniref:ATP-binding protein n=1 Tax=Nocardioides solisilvae TaxID=1542435 RepID=UPI000D7418D7|nr:ATP-binding protein [Nocardioides solisilvae]